MQHRLMQLSPCNYDFPRERQRFHSLNENEVAKKYSNREKEKESERRRRRKLARCD